MGRVTALVTREELDWLFEVHLDGGRRGAARADVGSAVLEGAEDSPTRITCYRSGDPDLREVPVYEWRYR
jgi:hypothetical protein